MTSNPPRVNLSGIKLEPSDSTNNSVTTTSDVFEVKSHSRVTRIMAQEINLFIVVSSLLSNVNNSVAKKCSI